MTEIRPTCRVIRPTESYGGRQGLGYMSGIAAETVGSTGLCMHVVTIPPGARAKAHLHADHESAVYVIAGTARTWFGERLEDFADMGPGEMMYIPPGIPHLPTNLGTEPCIAVIARTDPNEQESVVLLPDLDALAT